MSLQKGTTRISERQGWFAFKEENQDPPSKDPGPICPEVPGKMSLPILVQNSDVEKPFPFVIHTTSRQEFTADIAQTIFKLLTPTELLKSRGICRSWKEYVDCRTDLWRRMPRHTYMRAVRDGRLDICQMILEVIDEANPPDSMGWTPLHEAADQGHLEIVKLIMSRVENKNPPINKYETTPLHYASEKGHFEICKLIIESLEDKNPRSHRRVSTPFDCAALNGHVEICRLIIDHVEDKNKANGMQSKKTPLHWAAVNGHTEVVKLILDHVENRNPLDEFRKTPLAYARQNGHEDVIRVLETYKV